VVPKAAAPVGHALAGVTHAAVAPVAAIADRVLPAEGTTPPLVDRTVQTVRRTLDALAGTSGASGR
jgi:hypothetical protein